MSNSIRVAVGFCGLSLRNSNRIACRRVAVAVRWRGHCGGRRLCGDCRLLLICLGCRRLYARCRLLLLLFLCYRRLSRLGWELIWRGDSGQLAPELFECLLQRSLSRS